MIDWFVAALRHHAEVAFFLTLGDRLSARQTALSVVSRSAQ